MPLFVKMHAAVAAVFTEERGEGYVAAAAISPGELVLRVAPAAAVPKSAFLAAVCANCFADPTGVAAVVRGAASTPDPGAAASSGLIVCPRCQQAAHCQRCLPLLGAQRRHAEECDALRTLRAVNDSQGIGASAETTSVRLLLRLLNFLRRPPASEEEEAADAHEYGTGDVLVDAPEDIAPLCGEGEQLPEELSDAYVDVVKQGRLLAAATARVGLEAGLRLMAQVRKH